MSGGHKHTISNAQCEKTIYGEMTKQSVIQ